MAWPKGKPRVGAAKVAPSKPRPAPAPDPIIEEVPIVAETFAPEPAKEPAPELMEVQIVRGYWPISPEDNRHGKLWPGDIVKLPVKEAKGLIRKGIAEFPPEVEDDDE